MLEPCNDSQQRCFAGTALAEYGEKFALSNIKRNIPEHAVLAKILGYVTNAEESRLTRGIYARVRDGSGSGSGSHK